MAKSLDELIEFLLEQAALGGVTGISFHRLATLVHTFYDSSQVQHTATNHTEQETSVTNHDTAITTDRNFLSKVWTWLARHPDVSIGKDAQYNQRSLDEIEELFPGYTTFETSDRDVPETLRSLSNSRQTTPNVNDKPPSAPGAPGTDGPHIFVKDERMSLAICGHLPDPNRVFPSEWALLLLVAASGKEGLLQGELIRHSGQDKRSVPKRTDALHQKGYITKRTIYLKGNKTSRLYLRRFMSLQQSESDSGTATTDQLLIRHAARQLFDLLRNNPLIPQEDLADALGLTRPGRARVLVQLVRQLGKRGCVKRVRTAFGPSSRSKDLKVCVQYLKEPTEEDWSMFSDDSLDLDQSVEVLASRYEAEAAQGFGMDADNGDLERNEQLDLDITDEGQANTSRPNTAQWNPDRILTNLLCEAVQEAGETGITNSRARSLITGPFIKRTIESLLVRVSHRTLQSQPAALRHLSIFRTHVHRDGILQYIHYGFDTFTIRVQNGEADWKDVAGGAEFLEELQKTGRDSSVITELTSTDIHGFATRPSPELQVQNGEATMSRLLQESKVKPIQSRAGEPIVTIAGPGRFEIQIQSISDHGRRGRRRGTQAHAKASDKQSAVSTEGLVLQDAQATIESGVPTPEILDVTITTPSVSRAKPVKPSKRAVKSGKVLGRPRKFTSGTERYWRDMFGFIVHDRDPEYFKKNGKTGITNDPGALEIFKNRPADFDSTILEAIEHDLPVASTSSDISSQWIDRIKAVIHRSQPGLYITPVGYHVGSRGTNNAQKFIFRSSRLHEVDWSDRQKCWPWQHISSSASHSLRYRKFYPQSGIAQDLVRGTRGATRESSTLTPSHCKSVDGPLPMADEDMHVTLPGIEPEPLPKVVESDIGSLAAEVEEPDDATNNDTKLAASVASTLSAPELSATTISDQPLTKRGRPSRRGRSKAPTRLTRVKNPIEKAVTQSSASESLLIEPSDDLPTSSRYIDVPGTNQLTTGQSDSVQPVVFEQDQELRQATSELHDVEVSLEISISEPDKESTPYLQAENVDETSESITSKQEIHEPKPATANGASDAFLDLLNQYADYDPDADDSEIQSAHQEPPSLVSRDITVTQENGANTHPRPVVEQELRPQPIETEIQQSSIIDDNNLLENAPAPVIAVNKKRLYSVVESPKATNEAEESAPSTPQKRAKLTRSKSDGPFEARRPQVSKLCRILVLELVGLCSGLVPNVPWTLRRAMVPRWTEADVKAEQLNAKNVRAAIKALCESGKLKQITFAFRAKSGLMTKMSVVALQGIDSLNPAVLDLQNKMKEMEPADYVPPELEAEGQRAPNEMNKKRYRKEIQREEDIDDTDDSAMPRSTKRRSRKNTQPSGIMKAIKFSDAQQSLTETEPMPPTSPSPEPVITANCGFLTLKVPGIKGLSLPEGSMGKYRPPLVPLRFETNFSLMKSTTAKPTLKATRRNNLRRKRTARFDPETHKLIWKKPKKSLYPLSLEAVPNMKLSRDQAVLTDNHDPRLAQFDAEVDCVADWESRSFELFNETRAEQLIFINHGFCLQGSDAFHTQQPIEFKTLIRFDEDTYEELEESFPTSESWPPFVSALETAKTNIECTTSKGDDGRKRKPWKRKAVLEPDFEDDEDFHDYNAPSAKRRAQSARVKRPRRSLRTILDGENFDVTANVPFRRNRLTQLLRFLPEEEKYQIVVAVIVVRTLVGGIEKFIDWQIVCRLLPTQDELVIKDAWRTMANRYRSDVVDLTDVLQYRYIEALTNGEVPSVRFDAVHESDWEGIHKWGLKNLDKALIKKIEALPADRNQLLQRNDYIFNESRGPRDLLGYNTIQTNPRKEEIVSGTVFGKALTTSTPGMLPLGVRFLAEEEELDPVMSRAKSWIIATLLSRDDSTDITQIQAKLLMLAPSLPEVEQILEKAIKCLQRDKIVSRSQRHLGIGKNVGRGSLSHIRQYEASAKFVEQFDSRRMITTLMLRQAAKYKLEILDPVFSQGLPINIAKDAAMSDGEMVAILNLLAMNMIRVQPGNDVPASLWGLEWQKHGYTTRMIDKRALGFGVVLHPIKDTYQFGDPFGSSRASTESCIPRGEIDQADGQGKIPVWFDITHTFQHGLWETVLGAILGIVSIRPGVDSTEMARMFCHAIPRDQLELVLAWSERLGVIKKTDSQGGWESCEWWWMGVGVGGSETWSSQPE